ncbi:MAG TPA: DedA family protein [Rhodospirillales bacterium]|jgi:membrane protein YqaA with SNARE-associated domain|nr:MAG: Inner membrane protein YqaA [Alphaproteobacteria bacterium MarineAlpha3_Bin1]PPR74138.1 MAG: Inner membrane protein YqaA [Alphaproteobacteria bacterium MarineAlpha3_Bin2]HIC29280.1 DedA family protein [Rhodospirillales bacterium]HIM26005.1 DedA family protein [Rhodospirillales bacterium]HIN20673.1 DedA family protein [Rhodospirillales bacterium]
MEGYVGLFLSALLAATVLPFSSEAVLVGLMAAGDYDMIWLWFLASLGNVLGAAVNWGLGRFCLRWQDRRWFPVDKEKLDRAGRWFSRYGVWSLLLAWVPFIGDPLTFAAGVLRVNFWLFLLLVSIGKAGRYAVVILAAQGFL